MSGVPEGFHRVNFNCPDALFAKLKNEANAADQTVSKFLINLLRELTPRERVAAIEPIAAELSEELQVLLGRPAIGVEVSSHEDEFDLPDRLR